MRKKWIKENIAFCLENGEMSQPQPIWSRTKIVNGILLVEIMPQLLTNAEKICYAQAQLEEIRKNCVIPNYTVKINFNARSIYLLNCKRNGTTIRASCKDNDVFSVEIGMYLILSKLLNREINPSFYCD